MRRGWGCGRSAQRSGYIARGTTTTTTTTTTVLLCFIATDEFGQTGRRLTEGPLGKVWRGGLRKSQSQPLCLVKTKQENCIPPKKKKTHPTAPACSVEGHGHAAAGGLIEDNLAEQCVCSQLGGCLQQLTSTPPLRARNPGDRVHEQQAVRLVQKTMAAWKCSPRVMLLTSLSLVLTLTTVYIKHTRTEPPLSTRLPTALVTHRVKLVPARSGDALPSRRGGLGAGVKTCACDSCVADSGLSEWFDQRFNRDIVPLWTRENADLPDTVHHWWGSLQSQYKAQDLRTVLNRLFEIIPGQNPYQDHGWARCRRCAVVGNSGNLLGAGGGKEIDQHDFVMSADVFTPNTSQPRGRPKDKFRCLSSILAVTGNRTQVTRFMGQCANYCATAPTCTCIHTHCCVFMNMEDYMKGIRMN
ncbi:CMP-N-acetylneuraminate-beta-galactosamide-alpha-2,3-sialyltransferase 2 isoform X2 [Lampetra planeri]